jgi:hypothetical protein
MATGLFVLAGCAETSTVEVRNNQYAIDNILRAREAVCPISITQAGGTTGNTAFVETRQAMAEDTVVTASAKPCKAHKKSALRTDLDSITKMLEALIDKSTAHKAVKQTDSIAVKVIKKTIVADTFLTAEAGKVVSFEAGCDNGYPLLSWSATPGMMIKSYSVERSTDLKNWATAATIDGQCSSNRLTKFAVTDEYYSESRVYYRLKQSDKDGKVTVLPCVEASCQESMKLHVGYFPNPCRDNILVSIKNAIAKTATIHMFDQNNKMVLVKAVSEEDIQRGGTVLNILSLKPGTYTLEFISGISVKSMTVVKAG